MDNEYADLTLTCAECGFPFLWSAGEQRYYAQARLHTPRRCMKCRPLQRARYEARQQADRDEQNL